VSCSSVGALAAGGEEHAQALSARAPSLGVGGGRSFGGLGSPGCGWGPGSAPANGRPSPELAVLSPAAQRRGARAPLGEQGGRSAPNRLGRGGPPAAVVAVTVEAAAVLVRQAFPPPNRHRPVRHLPVRLERVHPGGARPCTGGSSRHRGRRCRRTALPERAGRHRWCVPADTRGQAPRHWSIRQGVLLAGSGAGVVAVRAPAQVGDPRYLPRGHEGGSRPPSGAARKVTGSSRECRRRTCPSAGRGPYR
jgi:hypothetical protein